jgi:hypothetical protein
MRDTDLQHALFEEGGANLVRFGLAGEAHEAALAYSREADRAKWFVLNYRYRLANSFLNALETGAPLVLRSLLARGFELRVLGEQFLNLRGWKDYGPYVHAYCGDALQFLATHQATEAPRGLRQLIGLENTVVQLLIGLAALPGPSTDTDMLRRTPMARYFQSDVQLSVWMRDKKQLGKTDLPEGTEHYLVYLPNLDSAHKFALLPQRAAELYRALAQPCTREQLPQALERMGYAPSSAQDNEYLNVLASYRAIDLPVKA